MEYIYFGDGLTSIGEGMLANCTSLKGIYIPQSVTAIGENMLKNCSTDCLVYGQKGSYAETFASAMGLVFSEKEFPLVY